MKYSLLLLLLTAFQISWAAGANDKPNISNETNYCEYKKGFIEYYEINDESILNYHWEELKSRRSGEYLTNLYIKYKNGNMALIEHKYCKMYNFTINFFVQHDRKNPIDDKKASLILSSLFNKHSAIKTGFDPSLNQIVEKKLEAYPNGWNEYKYDLNDSIQVGVEKSSIRKSSMIFKKLYTLYVGYGGL